MRKVIDLTKKSRLSRAFKFFRKYIFGFTTSIYLILVVTYHLFGEKIRSWYFKGYRAPTPYDLRIFSEYYEPITKYVIRKVAKAFDIFIDVGALIGGLSITFLQANPKGFVIAIEPLPENVLFLKYNLSSHIKGRYIILPYVVHSREGIVTLHVSETQTASIKPPYQKAMQSEVKIYQVKTVVLDDFMRKFLSGREKV